MSVKRGKLSFSKVTQILLKHQYLIFVIIILIILFFIWDKMQLTKVLMEKGQLSKWVTESVSVQIYSSPIRFLYAKFHKLKMDYTDGTRTTTQLMLITKNSTALLTKLEANSSGLMYTSSIMLLRQSILDKTVCTQTYMEIRK